MTSSPTTRPARSWTTALDGTRLRKLRREQSLTQQQLADRAGLSPATVTRLERLTHATCRGRTLARLAAALREQPAALRPPPATSGIQAQPSSPGKPPV